MEIEGPLSKVSNALRNILKRKGEAASKIKEALHELELVLTHITAFGLKVCLIIEDAGGAGVQTGSPYRSATKLNAMV
jgi:C4-type Zn-finger protein